MKDDVSVGYPLNLAMKQVNLFPHMVVQMTAIGEEAGALDTMLFKVAEFYEQEVNNAVDALSSLIEPMIMVSSASWSAAMVIGMYLPIFKLAMTVCNLERARACSGFLDAHPGLAIAAAGARPARRQLPQCRDPAAAAAAGVGVEARQPARSSRNPELYEAAPPGIVVERSHCPQCGHADGAVENIPLLSYVALRGKCRGCKAPISWQYPLVELHDRRATALACVWRFGLGWTRPSPRWPSSAADLAC
jgi:hypothetical protein